MDIDSNVVTVGLVGLIVVCMTGGIGVVIWLYGKFGELAATSATAVEAAKDQIAEAIQKSREAGDRRTDELGDKLDQLTARQHDHELLVEQRFVAKDSAAASYGRLETAVSELRQDVRNLIAAVRPQSRRPAP